MSSDQIFHAYEEHVSAVDAEFKRVYHTFGDRMQCRRGCSMCCSQMFSISFVEAAYISNAVKQRPDAERERLRAAARRYIGDAQKLLGDSSDRENTEAITPTPGMRLTCPALIGDACSIYEARPIICRKWGIPIFNPAHPSNLQACELNFKPGEEVEMEGLIEPQVALLEEWVELKGLARTRLCHSRATATVAEAILGNTE